MLLKWNISYNVIYFKLPHAALLKGRKNRRLWVWKGETLPLPPATNHLLPAARFRYISFCDLCLPRSASCQSVLPALSACSASPNLDQLSKSSTHHPFNKTTLNCPKPSLSRFWKKKQSTQQFLLWNITAQTDFIITHKYTDLTLSLTCPFLSSRNVAARRLLLGKLSLVKQRCVKLSRQSHEDKMLDYLTAHLITELHTCSQHVFPPKRLTDSKTYTHTQK